MSIFKMILTTAGLMLMVSVSFTLFAADNLLPPRVVDAGPDGDERYYSVYCGDGTRAALVKLEDKKLVCTAPRGQEKDVCNTWSVDEAARAACGQ